MADVTFRGYVMALTQGQIDGAVTMLETLLGLTNDQAFMATDFFQHQLGDPTFLPKAMGLRQAIATGTDAEIGDILTACFGVQGELRTNAVATVRKNNPT
jgi:hypothetical protein